MRRWLAALISMVACGFAQGADFDGSKLLICANMHAVDCNPGQTCTKVRLDEVCAPALIPIDFADKAIASPKRTTPIVGMSTDTSQILQGPSSALRSIPAAANSPRRIGKAPSCSLAHAPFSDA